MFLRYPQNLGKVTQKLRNVFCVLNWNFKMLERKTWEEFRNSGLLWWVNRTLHLFGWAIVVNFNDAGELVEAYPARCHFRGFHTDSETEGFEKLTKHIKENIDEIEKDLDL